MVSVVQQEIREKKLTGSKCGRCGDISYPPLSVCPKCGPAYSSEVKPFELPTEGIAVACTRLQVAPKGFPSPLTHCIVDLGVVKIVGTMEEPVDISSGEKVIIAQDSSARFPYIITHALKKTESA